MENILGPNTYADRLYYNINNFYNPNDHLKLNDTIKYQKGLDQVH